MKFKNKTTGIILETDNEFVVEQYKKNENFEVVGVAPKTVQKDKDEKKE